MNRRFLLALVAGALLAPGALRAQSTPPAVPAEERPPADPADVGSIDAIIAALYDVISGPAGAKRDWDRLRSLFIPGARLMPVRTPAGEAATAVLLSVDDYIRLAGPALERDGFFEREIGRRQDAFGHIAHVFSAYDSRRQPTDPEPFMRGINSIQLLNDGTRWWVVSVYWDSERPGRPIPPQYLAPPSRD